MDCGGSVKSQRSSKAMGSLIHPINHPLLSFPSETKAAEGMEELFPSLRREAALSKSSGRKDVSHWPFLIEHK